MQYIKKASAKILFLLVLTLIFCPVGANTANAATEKMYIPGGMPFGAKIYSDGVIVSVLTPPSELGVDSNPAVVCGILPGDIIKAVGKTPIKKPSALSECIQRSNGSTLELTIYRKGKEIKVNATPAKCPDGEYRLGVNVRDSMAGIGTVTFISPESGAFGGLGHGICDMNSGDVIPILRGCVTDVKINSIVKGSVGAPGEIRGAFTADKKGTLLKNTDCGVFGILGSTPNGIKPMPIADISEIKCGDAYIMCTLDGDGIKSYKIKIEKINSDIHNTTKNFSIKVCDKALLEKTAGIIQGMSGSPIIQNGKIVGAVTHVMINDPQRGFGIYIGNMLKEVPSLLS